MVIARVSVAFLMLAGLAFVPFFFLQASGQPSPDLLRLAAGGLWVAIDAVGWVLVPQLALAAAILTLAIRQAAACIAGGKRPEAPAWIDPAIESALLLGLLGTISGMVRGFVAVDPEVLEPAPLVHALGAALRSTFAGFAIALVGVWLRGRPEDPA